MTPSDTRMTESKWPTNQKETYPKWHPHWRRHKCERKRNELDYDIPLNVKVTVGHYFTHTLHWFSCTILKYPSNRFRQNSVDTPVK